MSPKQRLELRRSEIRGRLGAIAALAGDALTEAITTERDTLMVELRESEPQLAAAIVAEASDETRRDDPEGGPVSPEMRERLALREKAKVGNFLVAALRGRQLSGPEAELAEAAGCDGNVPLELWNVPRGESERRDITPAPGTVGVNLDTLRPAVFAPSVVDKLMLDMPMVESGTYASGTISTVATADAVAKSAAVPETAGAFTVQTTTPHRIGAAMNLSLEDIAAVGASNFESILRQHISLVLSDELDDQILNGDGSSDDLTGFFKRLTNPDAPAANVETWTRFLAVQSGGIDGLWASELSDIGLLVGVDTFRLAAQTFQGADSEESAASYLKRVGSSFTTNKRLPAKKTHVQQAILTRMGRRTMPAPMRLSVCPHWGFVSIDDVFSGSLKGERRFVISVLVGDVIVVEPGAYSQVAFRVST